MADPPTRSSARGGQHLDLSAGEVVYCHQCENEWYRSEGGLTCPRCSSEVTEICSAESDPRETNDMPGLPDELRTLGDHNPWPDEAIPDPDEDDIEEYTGHGPGNSMFFSRTIRSTLRPRNDRQSPPQTARAQPVDANDPNNVMQDFQRMLGGLLGPDLQQGPAGRSGPESLFATPDHPFGSSRIEGSFNGARVSGHRWTFTTGTQPLGRTAGSQARGPGEELSTYAPLSSPEDSTPSFGLARNSRAGRESGPHLLLISIRGQPDQIRSVLEGLFGAMGPMAGPGHFQRIAVNGNEIPEGQAGLPPLGLQGLFASLFNPANAVAGDAVYSQEALDRIISNLMEQHPTSNAPGPAPEAAIDSLPKRKLDEKMLGDEGKAECSVCMDDVTLNEEVVELPCKHWFHEVCARAWLSEHNTCPICRTGINPDGTARIATPPASANPGFPGAVPSGSRGGSASSGTSSGRPTLAQRLSRNEARLDAIRNTSRWDANESENAGSPRRRYQVVGDSTSSRDPAHSTMPGAFDGGSTSGWMGRRGSEVGGSEHGSQRRHSRSASSRGSNGSAGQGSTGSGSGGPLGWFSRRFGSGNGNGSGSGSGR